MIITITQNDKNVNHMFRFDKNKTNLLLMIVIYQNTLCFVILIMILSSRMRNHCNKCNTNTKIANVVSI